MRVAASLVIGFLTLLAGGCAASQPFLATEPLVLDPERPLERLAFGSCARQDWPQPIWEAVLASRPQAFVFLGDNIYADRKGAGTLDEEYLLLANQPGYQKLRVTVPNVLATWDDHDYGLNDAGGELPFRAESQKTFLRFFRDLSFSPRWHREGVYASYVFGPPAQRVQLILLDTRYFRSRLAKKPAPPPKDIGPYAPSDDPAATVLGEAQWKWLEEQLKVPATWRLIGSSIQVIADEQAYEKWGNFPREKQRLFDLIAGTKANGVVILSGDRHFAELSVIPPGKSPLAYPLYDLTSSSLNSPSKRDVGDENTQRIGDAWTRENFGLLTFSWQPQPAIKMEIRDVGGRTMIEKTIHLEDLTP